MLCHNGSHPVCGISEQSPPFLRVPAYHHPGLPEFRRHCMGVVRHRLLTPSGKPAFIGVGYRGYQGLQRGFHRQGEGDPPMCLLTGGHTCFTRVCFCPGAGSRPSPPADVSPSIPSPPPPPARPTRSPARVLPPTQGPGTRGPSAELCQLFNGANANMCRYPWCHHTHPCARCHGPHPVSECPDTERRVAGPTPPQRQPLPRP